MGQVFCRNLDETNLPSFDDHVATELEIDESIQDERCKGCQEHEQVICSYLVAWIIRIYPTPISGYSIKWTFLVASDCRTGNYDGENGSL